MKNLILLALCLLGLSVTSGVAQDQAELEKIDDKLSRHLATQMPGWKHKRGEPVEGSKNVVIERWGTSNRSVTISIVPHKTANEAREALINFVKYDRDKQDLEGLGDQAIAWGYGLSNIVLRKGRFNIFVSSYAELDSEPDSRSLTVPEKGERDRLEGGRLSREFARHIMKALNAP
jgi:hypothetical protein